MTEPAASAAPGPSLLAAGIAGRIGLTVLVLGGLWLGLLGTVAS